MKCNFQTQINYEKAKLDLLTGKIKTIGVACRAHKINHQTLNKLFKEKKSYIGHNRKTQNIFTTLEEQIIIDEYVQINNGVKERSLGMTERQTAWQLAHVQLYYNSRNRYYDRLCKDPFPRGAISNFLQYDWSIVIILGYY